MGSKRTADLIPLCHPIVLTRVGVDFDIDLPGHSIVCTATAETVGRTGVEMEAPIAVSVALIWEPPAPAGAAGYPSTPLHRVCEVGTYPANVWGLHEMHGNVWELTSDDWQGPLDPENSTAGDVGRWIVTKGGSWFEGVQGARFAARRPRIRSEMDTNLGLCVVRETVIE